MHVVESFKDVAKRPYGMRRLDFEYEAQKRVQRPRFFAGEF